MEKQRPKLRIELDIYHLNLTDKHKILFDKAQSDRFHMDDLYYIQDNGYDEMWYTKNKENFSVIIAVSKNGTIELYDSFKENILKSGRSDNYSLKDNLPVILNFDIILEKIHKYGINMITKEEKDFLDNI